MNTVREGTDRLLEMAAGEKARIASVSGGAEIERRLSDMGLALGAEVEVLVGGGRSTLLVAAGTSRMAIEPDLAMHIGVTRGDRCRGGRRRRRWRGGKRWR